MMRRRWRSSLDFRVAPLFRAGVLSLAASSALAQPQASRAAAEAPLPPPRPAEAAPSAPGPAATEVDKRVTPQPSAVAPPAPPSNAAGNGTLASDAGADSAACLVDLTALGAEAVVAEQPQTREAECVVELPVRLKSIATREGRVALLGEPLLSCKAAQAVSLYAGQILSPLAKGAVGSPLLSMAVGGYECRPRNRAPGGKISAHGKGLALDVTSFRFADGTTALVSAPASPQASAFLAGARRAACGYFFTVLGPGADAAHADHLHLDVEPHGATGTGRICQ